jgi:MtN3 and saliva related transmembrane protein
MSMVGVLLREGNPQARREFEAPLAARSRRRQAGRARAGQPCYGRENVANRLSMSALEILGFIAAVVTTLCWLPQALKTIQSKDTSGLSLVTQGALTFGVVLWLIYGLLLGDGPLIFANAVTLVLVATILVLKLRYG